MSFKPKSWHGVEIDAGEFVTSAGAEVIETNQNWNYSRSLLFSWAIPYYHFGVRASIPIGKFTGGVQVVQGWNNIYDNNSGKTIGLNGAYAWKKVTWSQQLLRRTGKDEHQRRPAPTCTTPRCWSTPTTISATTSTSITAATRTSAAARRSGPASPARRATPSARSSRWPDGWSVFDDPDGFSTGTAQSVKEFTATGEYKMNSWLMSRLEFRDDWSNQPFFQKNAGYVYRPAHSSARYGGLPRPQEIGQPLAMKKIEAIIQPFKMDEVKEALMGIGIEGITISEVRGHGRQKGHKEVYRGQEYNVDLLPKVKMEMVVASERSDEVIKVLTGAARTGKIGDGKIFIYDVAEAIRIRNGDRGDLAL